MSGKVSLQTETSLYKQFVIGLRDKPLKERISILVDFAADLPESERKEITGLFIVQYQEDLAKLNELTISCPYTGFLENQLMQIDIRDWACYMSMMHIMVNCSNLKSLSIILEQKVKDKNIVTISFVQEQILQMFWDKLPKTITKFELKIRELSENIATNLINELKQLKNLRQLSLYFYKDQDSCTEKDRKLLGYVLKEISLFPYISKITSFRFCACGFHNKTAGLLFQLIKLMTSLKYLDLNKQFFLQNSTYNIIKSVSKLRKITYLDLSTNGLNKKSLKYLLDNIESLKNLKELKLRNIFWGDKKTVRKTYTKFLSKIILSLPKLEYLDLSYNKLEDKHINKLAESICSLPNLKYLDLSGNLIKGDFTEFTKFIKENNRITHLNLRYNELSNDCSQNLLSFLQKLSKLKNLNIGNNKKSNLGQIIDVLPSLSEIRDLNISNQVIYIASFTGVMQQGFKNLKSLNIESSYIFQYSSYSYNKEFISFLGKCKNLENLNLNYTEITDQLVGHFLAAIKCMKKLSALSIVGNKLSREGKCRLIEGLPSNVRSLKFTNEVSKDKYFRLPGQDLIRTNIPYLGDNYWNITPNVPEEYVKAARFYNEEYFDKALEYFDKVLELSNNETIDNKLLIEIVSRLKCKMLLVLGKYQDSLEILELMIRLTPKSEVGDLLFDKANVLYQLGKYKEALKLYNIIKDCWDFGKYDRYKHLIMYNIACVLYKLNEYDEAIKYWNIACNQEDLDKEA